MSEKELIDKLTTSFLQTIKKMDIFAKINTFNNYVVFAAGLTLTVQFFCYFDTHAKIDCIIYQNDVLKQELWEIKHSLWVIEQDSKSKTELIPSLLKLEDKLFKEIVLNTNQLQFILESMRNRLEYEQEEEEKEKEEEEEEEEEETMHLLTLVEDSPLESPTNSRSYEMV
jgi:hypothetical protein